MPEERNEQQKDQSNDKPDIKESLAQRISQQKQVDSSSSSSLDSRSASDSSSKLDKKSLLISQIHLRGPKVRDMALFCRQLATLVSVGIPLLRSLKILAERTKHPKLRKATADVAQRVEEGSQLSSAMEANPDAFSPMVVNVVRIGETGGILDNSLLRLADLLERKSQIRKKIVAAIAYPAVVLFVACCVLIVIMTYAVPKFVEVYEGQEAELPGITKVVIGLSSFVMNWPIVYIPLIIILCVVVMMWLKTTTGRYTWDKIKISVPPLSVINTKIATARSTRTLGNLIAAGIPLVRSLEATAQTSENVVVGHAIAKTKEGVESGTKIENPLRESNVFPDMVVDMIAIGDESGTLDMMLLKIADIYEDDVDTSLKGLTAVLEPFLIVLLGFVVIIIALGMLLPYFNLVSVI